MSTIDLVPVTGADAHALADLRVAAMRDSLERVGRFDLGRARDRFLSSFEPAYTWHIVVDGARIGFVVVRPNSDGQLLDHLYIEARYQGAGYGSAVLSKLIAEADLQGVDIRVGALKESDANRFYARHGFDLVEESEWDMFYVRRFCRTSAGVIGAGDAN